MAVGRQVTVSAATPTLIAEDAAYRTSDNPLTVLIQGTGTTCHLGGPAVSGATDGLPFNTTLYPSGMAFALHSGEKLYGLSSSGNQTYQVLELNK